MQILAISDLHTDFRQNMLLVEQVPDFLYRESALIVAGDIADNLETIRRTLSALRAKFRQVFYVPGNHELWVRRESYDSLEKLSKILELCDSLDVRTSPARAGDVWVVPLFSWYSPAFDEDGGEEEEEEELQRWADFYFCRWPEGVRDVAAHFLRMNEPRLKSYDGPVISFSHFLPRRELLPPKQHLSFAALPKVAGSLLLDEQVRRLGAAVHVFGHSHINRDCTIDGVRYVQSALSYPREVVRTAIPFKAVWGAPARCAEDAA